MEKDTKVVVRSVNAGVHYGTFVGRNGDRVTLRDSRRVYRWQINHKEHGTRQVTCSELATLGPWGDSLISVPVQMIEIDNVIETIECTECAAKAIAGWPT